MSPSAKSTASKEIDAIIKKSGDWRGKTLAQLRAVIKKADPAVVEEVKWKKPSKPEGVAVWSHDGILCMAEEGDKINESGLKALVIEAVRLNKKFVGARIKE